MYIQIECEGRDRGDPRGTSTPALLFPGYLEIVRISLLQHGMVWLHAISKRTVSAGRRAFCSSRSRMERFVAGNSKETRGSPLLVSRDPSHKAKSHWGRQHMETVGDASRALQKYTVLTSSSVHIGVGSK